MKYPTWLQAAQGFGGAVCLTFALFDWWRGQWILFALMAPCTLVNLALSLGGGQALCDFAAKKARDKAYAETKCECGHPRRRHWNVGCVADSTPGDRLKGLVYCACLLKPEKVGMNSSPSPFLGPQPGGNMSGQLSAQQNYASRPLQQYSSLLANAAPKTNAPTTIAHPERSSTEPIIAYRCWTTSPEGLGPIGVTAPSFPPRKRMEAACVSSNNNHRGAPDAQCGCGIYGLETLQHLIDCYGFSPHRVYGRIALWGRVERHGQGYRAQYAYPQVIYRTPGIDADSIAAEWGIEVVPLPKELQERCDDIADRERYEYFVNSWRAYIGQHRSNIGGLPVIEAKECYDRHKASEESYRSDLKSNLESTQRGYYLTPPDPRHYAPTRSW